MKTFVVPSTKRWCQGQARLRQEIGDADARRRRGGERRDGGVGAERAHRIGGLPARQRLRMDTAEEAGTPGLGSERRVDVPVDVDGQSRAHLGAGGDALGERIPDPLESWLAMSVNDRAGPEAQGGVTSRKPARSKWRSKAKATGMSMARMMAKLTQSVKLTRPSFRRA